MKKLFYQIICVSLLFSCKSQLSPIELALNSNNEKILKVKKNISSHDLQIKLSVINNNKGVLISKPMDFSRRNYLPINELNHLIKLVFFPEKFKNKNKLKLEKNQIEFLKKSMSILPKDAGYDREKYFDSYVKFFVYGDKKEINSDKIKIFNKVGIAYGYLTEGAYIKTDNTSIILSATIKVNDNHIYNDDVYEYGSIGIPFFAELGREIIRIVQSK